MTKTDVPFRGAYLTSKDKRLKATAGWKDGRVYARATIPPEAMYLPLSNCIECSNALMPGSKVYADISGDLYPPPMLCQRCGDAKRDQYVFANEREDWRTTDE